MHNYLKKSCKLFFPAIVLITLIGCDSGRKYRRLVESQLQNGIVNDTLFHGIHFGMSYDEYYGHITKLGHQGKVTQGGDMSVQCIIDAFDTEIRMNFVAEYVNDSIQGMRVTYRYVNWAPWNRRTVDDRLWEDIVTLFKDKYGSNFIRLESDKSMRPALVWVLGNQRISLFQKKEAQINARFLNLRKNNVYK